MIELDVNNGSIQFKKPVDIGEFGKAMAHFGKMWKILFGTDASYKEFTDFLATCDGVKLIPGVKEKTK
jgi:hypothetical protein